MTFKFKESPAVDSAVATSVDSLGSKIAEERLRLNAPKDRQQVSPQFGYRVVEGDRLLTIVLDKKESYKKALDYLKNAIGSSQTYMPPASRRLGLIVLPKGLSVTFKLQNERALTLANQRILIRTSPMENTMEGAKKIVREITENYEYTSAYIKRVHPSRSPTF